MRQLQHETELRSDTTRQIKEIIARVEHITAANQLEKDKLVALSNVSDRWLFFNFHDEAVRCCLEITMA